MVKFMAETLLPNFDVDNLNELDTLLQRGTLLMWCARKGHLDIAEYLLERKANVNLGVWGEKTFTALHFACRLGFLDIVRCLVEKGNCDVSLEHYEEGTGLDMACRWGFVEIVKFLVEKGNCDVTLKHASDGTPLEIARRNKSTEVVNYIQETFPDKVAIIDLTKNGYLEGVKKLLAMNVPLDTFECPTSR